jgi:hypothetical protein
VALFFTEKDERCLKSSTTNYHDDQYYTVLCQFFYDFSMVLKNDCMHARLVWSIYKTL